MAKAWGKLIYAATEDKEPVIINKSKFVIGRALECDLIVPRKRISSRHCYLEMTEIEGGNGRQKVVHLCDISTNGTILNGTTYLTKSDRKVLKSGDSFMIGHDRNVRDTGIMLRFDAMNVESDEPLNQTREYVLDDEIEIVTIIGGEVRTETKEKDKEETVTTAKETDEENDLKKAQKKANEEMFYNLMCTICHEVFYKCVVLHPCVHCFCGGCYSDWMTRSNECPQCRTAVQQIAPNHTMNNVVKSFLGLNPDFERDPSDLEEQDKKNKCTRVMAFPLGLKRFYPFDDNDDDDYDYDIITGDRLEDPLDYDEEDRFHEGNWSGVHDAEDDSSSFNSSTSSSSSSYSTPSPPPLSPPRDGNVTPYLSFGVEIPPYDEVSPTFDDRSSIRSLESHISITSGDGYNSPSHYSDVISASDDSEADYNSPSHRNESPRPVLSSPLSVSSTDSVHVGFSSSDSVSSCESVSSDSSVSSSENRNHFPPSGVYCRQCPDLKHSKRDRKRNVNSDAGPSNSVVRHMNFVCTREQVHLLCKCCKEFMPRRTLVENKDGVTVPPQSCSNCLNLYCHMYWGCHGPCNGCLAPFDQLDFSDSHLSSKIINNNKYESKVLHRYLQGNGMDWMDLFKECLMRFRDGTFRVMRSLEANGLNRTYDQIVNQILCENCGIKVFSELAYQYREEIHNDELPQSVIDRPDCYYGFNCRSQYRKHHAKRLNHICHQTRF